MKTIMCDCKHEYQDKKFGEDRRAANKTTKGTAGSEIYRCTVCKREALSS